MPLLKRDDSLLLLVDVQEKLFPYIAEADQLLQNCKWLLQLAKKIEVPILISEQYTKGLGETMSKLKNIVNQPAICDKIHFSCYSDSTAKQAIHHINRKQIVLIGIEAHVCVMQTAIELKQNGYDVFIVVDAVSSRDLKDKKYALKRMREHYEIELITKEMVLFEWLRQAGNDLFKEVSKEFLK